MDLLIPKRSPSVHYCYIQKQCTARGPLGSSIAVSDHYRLLNTLETVAKPLVSPHLATTYHFMNILVYIQRKEENYRVQKL